MASRAHSRWVITLLVIFVAINFADKSIIGLAAAPIIEELGLTATQYGTVASSFYLLFSISAIAFGFLGNRFSGKWLLAGLALVWSIAQLPVLIPAAGFAVLLATRVLLGAGEGPGVPLGMHVAFTWVEQRSRGVTAALLTVGSGLGVIIGGPLLSAAISAYGWRSAFGILGALGLVWTLLWIRFGGDGPHAATTEAPPQDSPAAAPAEPRVPYRKLLLTGTWLGTALSGFAVYWGLALAIAFLPLYLREVAGFGTLAIGFLVTLPAYVSVAFMLLGSALSQRLIKAAVSRHIAQGMLGGAFAVVGGLAMLALTRIGAVVVVLVLVAIGFGIGNSQTPLSQAAVADTTPVRQRGAVLGIWYGIVALASVASPTVTGVLVDSAATPADGYQIAFDVAGAMMVVGGLICMLIVRPDRDAAQLTQPAAPTGATR